MSLLAKAIGDLLQAAQSPEVALVAGIPTQKWTDYHVFYGESHYIRGRNRGRLPFIEIINSGQNYNHDSEPNYGGTLIQTFKTIIHTGDISRKNLLLNQYAAQDIANALLTNLRGRSTYFDGTHSIDQLEESPFGYSLAIDLTCELTAERTSL